MHTIGDYTYDPNRLIFYSRQYDALTVDEIRACVEEDDNSKNLQQKLDAYDAGEVKLRPGALLRAGICLTSNCNFRCNYCNESSVDGHKEPLTVEDVAAFVSDAMRRWAINKLLGRANTPLRLTFTGGGEPTYDWPLFVDSVRRVRQKGLENSVPLSLALTTNGLLNPRQRAYIAEHFDSVMVSYDGMPEVHNKNRKRLCAPPTSTPVETTIGYLSDANLDLTIRTTIWQSDFGRLKEMADFIFGTFGADARWSVLPVIPTGRAMDRVRKEHGTLSRCDFLHPYLEMKEYAKVTYGAAVESPLIRPSIVNTFYCGAISIFCSCPWLLPNRSIISCIEACDTRTTIGEIRHGKVVYFGRVKDPLLEVCQQKFNECRTCIAYRFCKGGCPVRHLMNRNARTSMDDWECDMLQSYWTHILQQILEGREYEGWRALPLQIGSSRDIKVYKLVGAQTPP